ncbi:unnamed protein product [Linum trigynum]|uniref:Rad60/SUMO-like domain-containing protein n=1 Tax=Linum trigynum TaxID=586398 RepID=A0AAV2E7H3_9ROSI
MTDSTDDFEPLFDYRRVQPQNIVDLDDDDAAPVCAAKKRRIVAKPVIDNAEDGDVEVIEIVKHNSNNDKEEEEDWLPPPPKVAVDLQKQFGEDSTIKQLRLKKQELQQSFAKSADDVFLALEEAIRQRIPNDPLEASAMNVTDHPSQLPSQMAKISKPVCDRPKIVISIQDQDGLKQYRLFKDDKFERFFKMYAEKAKVDVQNLVFSFDGDKINPNATPDGLDMEDGDIIEVLSRKR